MIKLSIIVPIYKVKNYLRKCVNSLITQNVPDEEYEIILVDDGDPENSIEVIDDIINRKNIRILRKENGGLSSARNAGLDIAVGEYVWFVDSDDWINENCLKDIFKIMDESPNVIYQTTIIPEGGRFVPQPLVWEHDYIKTVDFYKSPHFPGAPFYLYKRDYLNQYNCRFMEGILHEDTLFTPCSLYYNSEIRLYKTPIYHCLYREGSITTSFNPKRCYDLMLVINTLLDFYRNKVKSTDKTAFSSEITDCILFLLSLTPLADKKTKKEVDNYIKTIKEVKMFLSNSPRYNTRILGYIGSLPFISIPVVYRKLYFLQRHFR